MEMNEKNNQRMKTKTTYTYTHTEKDMIMTKYYNQLMFSVE